MTTIIIATVSASVVYFLAAFVATMRDRLISRFPNYSSMNTLPELEPVAIALETILPTPAEWSVAPVVQEVIPESAPVTDYVAKNIRELRAYIRENELQERVRATVGKNVSKCSMGELLMAIA